MVESQLVSRGIKDEKVLEAFRKVPRHEFVPENMRYAAYDDGALPIGSGQTISQPYMVAVMTELLKLKGGEKVLEVGTGSGYQAAILAEICRKVITIERFQALSDGAKNILDRLGYDNIEFIVSDGTEGYAEETPYDAIIVTAGCPDIPQPLADQLAEGSHLVLPVGERYLQTLTVATKEKGKLKIEKSIGCVFVPLVGKYGWPG
ncbi:protein-L-isoaspartate O-methyltransferase [candidate division WOR-1 bacterium RIFCSPHIGHO2_01_FULL_53_15]|uniref:Protein-L-isoaspartate O-methyltransferase n=1 Tax=candidate division WOR-1 bacterium RIFCSPHIGHO2_01_FULL_53_15 TaxID=1802564 RepID=A0A1F4Q0V0_UNCSA|nr:MAG: protein-L-isoaspartate O-methyltransferase [candidate division WOR-1 bacterium RIFCSPHIGHO2_01_FULL_53_15]OGC10877.1 MAG: protein-L-isoaspartate O-methyltransferase [candidate division WOR-1 bacterium RIFCSPHIGHO2_02_FULL_53_26]